MVIKRKITLHHLIPSPKYLCFLIYILIVVISYLLSQMILGIILILEIFNFSYDFSKKVFHSKNLRIIFSIPLTFFIFSILGLFFIIVDKIIFSLNVGAILFILILLNILFIIQKNSNIFFKLYCYFLLKIKKKKEFKFSKKDIITRISFFLIWSLLFINILVFYCTKESKVTDPYNTLHNLNILKYLPWYFFICLVLMIIFIIFEFRNEKFNFFSIEISFFIYIVILTGNIFTNWIGIDAVMLKSLLNQILYIKNYSLLLSRIDYFVFHYSTTPYSLLSFFFSFLFGTDFFLYFILPLINFSLYLNLILISSYILNIKRKNTRIYKFLLVLFLTSPIQLKFIHIANSETIGTYSLTFLLFSIICNHNEVARRRTALIFISFLLSLYHFSHTYLIVPLSIFYYIYFYCKNNPKTKHILKRRAFYTTLVFSIFLSYFGYLLLEISHKIRPFIGKLIPNNIFPTITITIFSFNFEFYISFLIISPLFLFFFIWFLQKWKILIKLKLKIQKIRIFICKMVSNANKIIKFGYNNFLKICIFLSFNAILFNQFYSHLEISIEQFFITVLFFGQVIVLGLFFAIIFEFLSIDKEKILLYLSFLLFLFCLIFFYLIAGSFSQETYISYMFRLINWGLFSGMIIIFQGKKILLKISNFIEKNKFFMIEFFLFLIILLNYLASVWEYAY